MNENHKSPVFPFSDGDMKYDERSHRYVLTTDCVLRELGVDLTLQLDMSGDANTSTLPDRLLQRVSQSVYLWLYRDSMNPDWLEYILATYPPLRERVKEMLLAQTLYVLNNNFIGDFSGVNIARGTSIDINWLRGRAKIADEVEEIANQFIPGLGYSLKYAGALPYVPRDCYHRGY